MSDQETNLMLVAEVGKRPILFNFNLPSYSKKHETEKAWEEVGNIVKLTAAECKARWKNIRAVFVRHMKPLKSGSSVREKKAYYLSDALQFTVPYIRALGKPSGNLSQPPLEEEGVPGGDDKDGLAPETHLPSSSSLAPTNSSPRTSTFTLPLHQDQQSIKQVPKNKRVAKNDAEDEDFIEYLNHKQKIKGELSINELKKEGMKMFLLSLLPDIMSMDDREVRIFKRKALDAVDEILLAKSVGPHFPSRSVSSYSFSSDMLTPTNNIIENSTSPEPANS